jgi:hypothetical protein
MTNVRLPRALCTVVNDVLRGSHEVLNLTFVSSGAPGPPPNLSHARKWGQWLFETDTCHPSCLQCKHALADIANTVYYVSTVGRRPL